LRVPRLRVPLKLALRPRSEGVSRRRPDAPTCDSAVRWPRGYCHAFPGFAVGPRSGGARRHYRRGRVQTAFGC